MRKLLPIGIRFGDQLIADINLQMVAVGGHDGSRKTHRLIASGPMKGRLENDFFLGITLRVVKTGGWFGLAEYIHHPVIANAIAGTKIAVSVVVEGTPAEPARILRIGRQLVVNAGMA